MRRGVLPLILGALGAITLLALALCPAPQPPVAPAKPPQSSQVVAFSKPLRYCIAPRIQNMETRVQVLVDGSGSMAGIRGPALRYVRWIEQGISRSRGAMGRGPVQTAQFDRRRGILSSVNFAAFAREYTPTGETTLHEAIASSADWDVTYILTDGVAAAGSGDGDCAAGVDAACVARAFQQALLQPRGPSGGEMAGLWVFPLRTTHDGVYYTERPVAPAQFNSNQLKQDMLALYPPASTVSAVKIDVREPGVDKAGNLKYQYHGPRALLLVIIARSDEIGRAAVASLVEVAAQNGVMFSDADAPPVPEGLEAFRPIEVYPGWVPPVEWSALIASDVSRPSGTIDVSLRDRGMLTVDCPPQKHGEADYLLSMDVRAPSSRCVDVYQLPQFQYQLQAQESDQSALSKTIPAFSRESTDSGDRLALHITCDNGGDRPCENPIRASYLAARRFDLGFATGPSAVGAARQIEALSTDDPVWYPNRIYAFRQVMSFFYDNVATQMPKASRLADILICNGRGK